MHIKCIFELSAVLETGKFQKIFDQLYKGDGYLDDNEDEYIDHSLSSKGITVVYRNSQYKKKVKLVVNTTVITDGRCKEYRQALSNKARLSISEPYYCLNYL